MRLWIKHHFQGIERLASLLGMFGLGGIVLRAGGSPGGAEETVGRSGIVISRGPGFVLTSP